LGGSVLVELNDYALGASMLPDEDEMKTTPIRYGRIQDPDGYIIEVIDASKLDQKSSIMSKIRLNVLDLNDSTEFYEKILGMNLLRRRSNINNIPKEASMCTYVVINTSSFNFFQQVAYFLTL